MFNNNRVNWKCYFLGFLFLSVLFPTTSQSQESRDTSILLARHLVLFETASYDIPASDVETLDSIAQRLDTSEDYYFLLTGHTDAVGGEAYNQTLSENRVNAVAQFLVEAGVDPARIKSNYYGESDPVSDNQSEKGKQLNRRATLDLIVDKKLILLRGTIKDDDTKEGLEGEVELSSRDFKNKVRSDSNGRFSLLVPSNEPIILDISADNYFFKSIKLNRDSAGRNAPLVVPLPELALGKKFVLEELLFQGNLSELLKKSEAIPPRILKMMISNPEVCIEIAGHVNVPNSPKLKIGSHSYKLSVARALEVYDYLMRGEVSPDRVLAKGYGNWEMKFPKARSQKDQAANRRVEIKIMDCQICAESKNDTITNKGDFKRVSVSLVKKLGAVAEKDQEFRKLIKEARKAETPNEAEIEELERKMLEADAANLKVIQEVLDTKGWLGPGRVGARGARALFLVIQHAPLEVQEKYLPMLKSAVDNSNASPSAYALLQDRILTRKGLKQIYGSQLLRDDQTGNYYVAEIENPEEVDMRREKLGLQPMAVYVKNWNIEWNLQAHKQRYQ